MENPNQNIIDSISPIISQMNTAIIKLAHLNQANGTTPAQEAIMNTVNNYGTLLCDVLGLEWKGVDALLEEIKSKS